MSGNPTAPSFTPETGPRDQVRRLYRSRTNRVFAGVCGGIAEHFGMDPSAVRLATVVIGLFTAVVPLLVVYVAAAIILPEGEGGLAAGGGVALAPGQAAVVFGALLILVGIAAFADQWLEIAWERVWPLVLVGAGVLLLVMARRR